MGDWTKEPWPDWWPNMVIGEDKAALSHAEYQRARACVNALAGIDDPEAFMRDVRTVVTSNGDLSELSWVMGSACADAVERLKALLAKLPGGAS